MDSCTRGACRKYIPTNTCNICNKKFSRLSYLKIHKSKDKFNCRECPEVFCTKTKLTIHMNLKHGKKKFKCEECLREFKAKWNLERHIKSRKCNECHPCGIVFCTVSDLKSHTYITHKCQLCEYCGKKYEFLDRHISSCSWK